MLGLYTYVVQSPSNTINGTGLTLLQLLSNDVLSFGIAVCTMYFLLPKKIKIKRFGYKRLVSGLFTLIAVLASLLLYFVPKSIVSLFLSGIVVISLGELIALICNENGPFLQLVRTWKLSPFVTFWVNCISIGILYECVNYFFPFWIWIPGVDISHGVIEMLVILFGYVVLLHPIMIFWQLLQKSRWLSV